MREYRKDLEFPPMGQVVKQVFTPGGQADHRQFVVPDKNWYRESPSEFEKTMVLVQATSPRPLTDFAFGPVEPEPEPIPIPDNDIVF